MQANPIIRLDEEHLVETCFEQFRCPAEILMPYEIVDLDADNVYKAYTRSRFVPSLWNMDSPWMVAIFGTLFLNFLGFVVLALLRSYLPSAKVFGLLFSGFAGSVLIAIPLTYACVVLVNLVNGYGRLWYKKMLAPTHIGVTELGFKLYVRGKFYYNYPNLAVWKDIDHVDIVNDSMYGVPSISYHINSNYTWKDVILPITGFQSEQHLRVVLQHLFDHVDHARLTERFVEMGEKKFEAVLRLYRENQSHVSLLE